MGWRSRSRPIACAGHRLRLREELLAGALSAAAGEEGDDPEAGAGERELGIPTVLDLLHPAGPAAGPATAVRPNRLGCELRLPAQTECVRRGSGIQRLGRADTMTKLADVLEVDLRWLITGEVPPICLPWIVWLNVAGNRDPSDRE
jgi:hypothetical protein